MSRLFTLLCLAMFTIAMPACDEEDPKDTKDPGTTAEDSSSGGSGSAVGPDDLAPGDDETDETGATTGTDEEPGPTTIAGPHISTDATL